MLLHRRGHEARDADAVAAHDDGLLLLLLVEVHGAHLGGVVRAQDEDVARLDALVRREPPVLAAGARVALGREAHVDDLALVVAADEDRDVVVVGLVGARRASADERRRAVDEDATLEAHRAREPDVRARRLLHVGLAGEEHLGHAEGAREADLVDLVVAADDDHDDVCPGGG